MHHKSTPKKQKNIVILYKHSKILTKNYTHIQKTEY
jgi:hypothetical protein